MVNDRIKNLFRSFFNPIVNIFILLKIHPNFLTITGSLISLFAGILYAKGFFVYGGLVLLFGSLYDTFDGMVARKTNKVSDFGAFLDSTLDRFNEFFVLTGILIFFYKKGMEIYSLVTIFAIFSSIMVSYTRARAEGLGIECKKGFMGRVERMVFLIIISFLPLNIYKFMVSLFTFLTFITVIQRILIVKAGIKKKEV
uniref:CDP-alcohol phosphatidyltransferase family protein n=1 Tax=candidate division WOR-3 bacterium TaxID=2052148 RepID=A0A7C3N6I8_UNCW3